jgi:hypothetical protein
MRTNGEGKRSQITQTDIDICHNFQLGEGDHSIFLIAKEYK